MRRGSHNITFVSSFFLLIAVILVSVAIFFVFKELYEESEEGANCATQIRVHASATRLTYGLKAPSVTCPTKEIVVPADEDDREVLADAMKSCWDLWGNGQYQLFGNVTGIFCHVCAMAETNNEVTDFGEYLKTTKVPSRNPLAMQPTYAEYLSGTKYVEGDDSLEGMIVDDGSAVTIPQGRVGVVFYYVRGLEWYEKLFNNHLGTLETGATAGAVTGGIIAFGVVSAVTGAWIPIGIVTLVGAVGGGYYGAWTAVTSRYTPDYLSMVVVRPMSSDDIQMLGCTYAPVGTEN